MIIYLIGIGCVGKTTIGKMLADNMVIAGTPSGMQYPYLNVYLKYKKDKEIISISITDRPENILKRLTFYDTDSNLLEIDLTEEEKEKYINSIIGDINYFKKSYSKADIQLCIANVQIHHIPDLITKELKKMGISKLPAANIGSKTCGRKVLI